MEEIPLAVEDAYDLIIQINGMKSLEEDDWEEEASTRGLEVCNKKKDERSVVVSVVGNANKGKSYILTKISGQELPSGYSVTTEGLSIKYPTIKKQNIILLDTAGFETPLIENDVYQLKHDKEYYKEHEEEYIKEVTELSRDRQMTEYFLQKFVISQANILICVVGQLTYSEQKFLNKIKKECGDKRLFIIHNLQNLITKQQVEDYIKDTLECSLTFKLKEFKMVSFENKTEDEKKNNNDTYYTEIFSDEKNEQDIVHLIMAHEKTEAGNYYNNSTINYIINQIIAFVGIKPFPIETKLKEFLFNISGEIMEEKIENIEDIIIDNKFIKIKQKEGKNLHLKKFLVDELGLNSFMETKYKPKYRYYKTKDGKKFIIQFIMCGTTKGVKIGKAIISESGEYYVFPIQGTKESKEDTKTPSPSPFLSLNTEKNEGLYINKRESGFFNFHVKVPASQITLADKKYKKISKERGIVTVEFDLLKDDDDEFQI